MRDTYTPPIPEEEIEPRVEIDQGERLEAAVADRVRAWSRQWLEDYYNNPIAEDYLDEDGFRNSKLELSIAGIVGASESLSEGIYEETFSEGIRIFLLQLIDFVKSKSGEDSESKKLQAFLRACERSMFGQTPDISESLGLTERLILVSRADRVPEMARIGYKLEGEMIYNLNFSGREGIESIVEKVAQLSVPEKLDVIYHLGKVGKQALHEGYSEVDAVNNIEHILRELAALDTSPLIMFAAELAFREIRQEESRSNNDDPSDFEEENQESLAEGDDGIDRDKLHKESNYLKAQISPDKKLDGELLRVASDAVGVFDRTLIPRQIGRVNFDRIATSREIILPTLDPDLHPVHFSSYFGLSGDKELVPFARNEQDEQLPLLIQYLHEPKLRNLVETDLGIDLNQIPLRSQIHLLRFLAGQNHEGFDRLRSILQAHPEASDKILNSFLAVAEDMQYGEVIISLAEKLDTELAKEVFDKYLEVVAQTEHVRQLIMEVFQKQEVSSEDVSVVVKGLLQKANDLLLKFNNNDFTKEEALRILDQVRAQTILFTNTFKALKQAGVELFFDQIKGMEFSIRQGRDMKLEGDEYKQMEQIYKTNYDSHPELRDELLVTFRKAIGNKDNRFYILKHDGRVIAFCRFEFRSYYNKTGYHDYQYFGAFNIAPSYQKSRIGEVMMEQTLDQEAEIHHIIADCEAGSFASSSYIEHGFIANKYYDYKKVPSLTIDRDDTHNYKYVSKEWSRQEIVKRATESLEESNRIKVISSLNQREVPYSLLNEGWVMTRFFTQDGKYFSVFEKDIKKIPTHYIV